MSCLQGTGLCKHHRDAGEGRRLTDEHVKQLLEALLLTISQ